MSESIERIMKDDSNCIENNFGSGAADLLQQITDDQNAYFDSTTDRNRLRVGGDDGPENVESFKELHSNMKTNIRSMQIQTVRSILEKLMKKKNEITYKEATTQTLDNNEIAAAWELKIKELETQIEDLNKEIHLQAVNEEFIKKKILVLESDKIKLNQECNNYLNEFNQMKDEIYDLKRSNFKLMNEVKDNNQGKKNNYLDTEDDIEIIKKNHSKEIESLRVQMRDEIKKYDKLQKKMTIMINPAKDISNSVKSDFAEDHILEIEEELEKQKKENKSLNVLHKRDVRQLQEKIERLEEEISQLKLSNQNLEKRNSKVIDQAQNNSFSSSSAYVNSPKKQGSISFKDYFGSAVSDNKTPKNIALQASKTTSPIKQNTADITSDGDASQRDIIVKESKIEIIEGKLDDSESDINIKSPRSPK